MGQYSVELLSAAYSDLDEIFDYILLNNPQAAENILERIMESLSHLEHFPLSGAPLVERSLAKFNFRMVIVDPFIAFYRFMDNKVYVYRILHGSMYYTSLLQHILK